MIVGVVKETRAGERRVALVPDAVKQLAGDSLEILVEADAGAAAGFPDSYYSEVGATIAADAAVLHPYVWSAVVARDVRSGWRDRPR